MNYKFDFVKSRKTFFSISLVIALVGTIMLFVSGLNLGVDFQSGTTMDITTGQSVTKEEVSAHFESIPTEYVITVAGDKQDRVTVRFSTVLSEDERNQIISSFQEAYGEEQVSVEENTVDAEIAREFGRNTILYVGLASLLMTIKAS